ncbi:Uncharacterized conserved protein YndB, AHSA1/START domain [Streptomyces sp. DvalAA-14]|uniref:SRPBCC family protein n=1 Tax=unclassified Streptomyces TaxID=2593676 RepID=UPI00081AEE56|nr:MULTISPECIES: SRPBCC domain-containing protein [unclassified Streptomyces]MYS22880.1 SRPBCC domain-containing protein [Streptomyces sp. SID4948]SCE23964.1 Uncharacterized conserved protein YndB, AHSA1/START domain [Streptomyces sp. DvalAA-14]
MSTTDTVTASVRIAAAPETVFGYFTDAALMVRWLGQWADLRPEADGLFALDMETTSVRGRFIAVEPPNRVLFTWGIPGSDVLPAGSTTVEVRLTADGPDTIVELFHHDLPTDQLASHTAGWTSCLGRLGGIEFASA